MNTGCKDCTKRYVGCHNECEIYKSYVQKLFELKQQIREGKRRDGEWNSHHEEAKRKARRRSGKK